MITRKTFKWTLPLLFFFFLKPLPWLKVILSGRNTYSSLKSVYRQEVHKFHNFHCCIHRVGYKDLAWERESAWICNTLKYTTQRVRLSQLSFSTMLHVLPTSVSLGCLWNRCGIVQWGSSSCLTGKLQRIPLLLPLPCGQSCFFPVLGHTWGWALTHSSCYLHWLQLAQLSPDQLIWHRAGGALMHVILPLLRAALTPCAGRLHGWWQQCPYPCGRGFQGFASG